MLSVTAAALASEAGSSSTPPLSFLQMPLPPVPATPPLIPGAPLLPALPSLALAGLMPTLPTPPLVPGVPVPPRPPQPPLLPLMPRRRLDAGFSFERRRRADDAAEAPPPQPGPNDGGAGPGLARGYGNALPFLPFSLPGQYPGMSPNDVGSRVAFAVQGMTPFGTDCCNCVSNEEDYRMCACPAQSPPPCPRSPPSLALPSHHSSNPLLPLAIRPPPKRTPRFIPRRVRYPHTSFLEEASLGISSQLEEEAAAALESGTTPRDAAAEAERLPEGAASFLQGKPQLGFSPYGAGTRQMTNTMGLAPAGIDCCPCMGNEEDYRVYPWNGIAGSVVGGRKGIIGGNPSVGAMMPFL